MLKENLMKLYIQANCRINEFKQDEAGMEVIQVVMLIAVGVIVIGGVWLGINGLLENIWTTLIEGNATKNQGIPDL